MLGCSSRFGVTVNFLIDFHVRFRIAEQWNDTILLNGLKLGLCIRPRPGWCCRVHDLLFKDFEAEADVDWRGFVFDELTKLGLHPAICLCGGTSCSAILGEPLPVATEALSAVKFR
jgi:hypothetical protein